MPARSQRETPTSDLPETQALLSFPPTSIRDTISPWTTTAEPEIDVPHHIPVPVPVNHPVAVPYAKVVKVPEHVPVEVSKPVPIEIHQQVPVLVPKTVPIPQPVPVPHPVAINKPVYYPVPHPISYQASSYSDEGSTGGGYEDDHTGHETQRRYSVYLMHQQQQNQGGYEQDGNQEQFQPSPVDYSHRQ